MIAVQCRSRRELWLDRNFLPLGVLLAPRPPRLTSSSRRVAPHIWKAHTSHKMFGKQPRTAALLARATDISTTAVPSVKYIIDIVTQCENDPPSAPGGLMRSWRSVSLSMALARPCERHRTHSLGGFSTCGLASRPPHPMRLDNDALVDASLHAAMIFAATIEQPIAARRVGEC